MPLVQALFKLKNISFWVSKIAICDTVFEIPKSLFYVYIYIYIYIYVCFWEDFCDSQKPKTAILESQRQLFSKLCLRRNTTIKKNKKVSFLSCFESQKELFLELKNNYFWDCFWDSKKLVLPVFYSVLSFSHFFERYKVAKKRLKRT